jgi:uncharacterized protein
MEHETVLITGASGFIGQQLVNNLLSRDFIVYGYTRQKDLALQHPNLHWIQDFAQIPKPNIDYVINLAGENIGAKRWTQARKQRLLTSRVKTTTALFDYLKQQNCIPKRIISGSAIGYYGIDDSQTWQQVCDESALPQAIFMSELCQQWEHSAQQFKQPNLKIIRLGVVLGQHGGILPQLLLPIKLRAVGKIGSGLQPLVWVHIQDVLEAIYFLMTKETQGQIFNLVAPERTHQAQFVHIAAQKLKRKPLLQLPACTFKLLLGEQSQLILNGQYVKPQALQNAGFRFAYPTLKQALDHLIR